MEATLEVGRRGVLRAGERRSWPVELERGEFFRVKVEQRGIDLFLRWLGPGGEELRKVDSPTGDRGTEELIELAEETGLFTLEIAAPEGSAEGEYEIVDEERRAANDSDRQVVEADRSFYRARELYKSGDRAAARTLFEGTLPAWQKAGFDHREADTRDHLCRLYWAEQQTDEALSQCRRALDLYRQVGAARQLAVTAQNTALFELDAGDAPAALLHLREALERFEDEGDRAKVALVLARLGSALYRMGQWRFALDHVHRALDESRALGDEPLEALSLSELGTVLMSLNRPAEALRRFAEADRIYARTHSDKARARTLRGLAEASLQLGELDAAESYLTHALGIQKALGSDRGRASLLNSLAIVHRHRGDLAGARRLLEEALPLSREELHHQGEATILVGLGYLDVLEGEPQRGLELLRQAEVASRDLRDPGTGASARARTAEALYALGRLHDAWSELEPALADVEGLRGEAPRQDLRLDYFAGRQDYFGIAVDVLMALAEREPEGKWTELALATHDRRLARELRESIAADPRSRESLRDPEQAALRRRLRALARLPESRANEAQIDQLIAELYRQDAASVATPPTATTLSLDQIRSELLDPSSLLLVYALGDDASYLWAVSGDGVSSHRLRPRHEIETLVAEFTRQVARPSSGAQRLRRELGQGLGRLLLGPVAAELGERRLVIVADGVLQTLPFAALSLYGSDEADRFLIEDHEITLVPSISLLASLRQREASRSRPRGGAVIFADPVFEADDPRFLQVLGRKPPQPDPAAVAEVGEAFRGSGLGRLEGTRVEGEAVFDAVGHRTALFFEGFDASRKMLEATPLDKYRVLHFATHAIQHRDPELSGLVLSLLDERGRSEDGFLRAFEIADLDLASDLVVLSACETANGELMEGEGTLGLAWSFIHAGASRVVASLWRVGDRPTARLMDHFYQGFFELSMTPAAALRRAQLAVLRQPESFPADWAGFIIEGDWRYFEDSSADRSAHHQPRRRDE
ncbi:MAG: CHAT domain-containing protein [Acidobacteria bacterium]|nr:CHAT domain-containing protein [Acidobacteriota bacterium]